MHQSICQFAGGGKQQQAFGIKVESTDCNPAPLARLGQSIKDGRTTFRIGLTDNFTGRLVVQNHARWFGLNFAVHCLAINAHLVGGTNPLANVRWHAIDRYPALHN